MVTNEVRDLMSDRLQRRCPHPKIIHCMHAITIMQQNEFFFTDWGMAPKQQHWILGV